MRIKHVVDDALADERRRRDAFFAQSLADGTRDEFINGKVVKAMPERVAHYRVIRNGNNGLERHIETSGIGGMVGRETLMVRLERNDYHPDLCYWPREVSAAFADDQAIFPAPVFVMEVLSESTRRRDRGVKLADYAEAGVREYWIVDAEARTVEQYVPDASVPDGQPARFALLRKLDAGTLPSAAIDGWSVDVAALFAAA